MLLYVDFPNVFQGAGLYMRLVPGHTWFTVLTPERVEVVTLARGNHFPKAEDIYIFGGLLQEPGPVLIKVEMDVNGFDALSARNPHLPLETLF